MDDRAIVERQLGRPPRAFRRVAVRCPFGLPAVTEQAPFDARARRSRRSSGSRARISSARSRGSRRPAASSVGRGPPPGPRAAEPRARTRRAACAPAGAHRSGSAGAGARQPQVPACPRRVRARATRLRARRPDPRRGRAALARRTRCCSARMIGADGRRARTAAVDEATPRRTRRIRSAAYSAAERADRDRDRRAARRIGLTFTLAGARRAYDGADPWVRDALHDALPDEGRPRPRPWLTPRSHVYARRASDYTP